MPLPRPRRSMYWVLNGHTPVPADNVLQWGMFYERMENRRVALSEIQQPEHDPVHVSTIFIGMDMRHFGDGPPMLFESRVMGGPLDTETRRYCTWGEATAGHHQLVEEAQRAGEQSTQELREQLKALANKDKDKEQN